MVGRILNYYIETFDGEIFEIPYTDDFVEEFLETPIHHREGSWVHSNGIIILGDIRSAWVEDDKGGVLGSKIYLRSIWTNNTFINCNFRNVNLSSGDSIVFKYTVKF